MRWCCLGFVVMGIALATASLFAVVVFVQNQSLRAEIDGLNYWSEFQNEELVGLSQGTVLLLAMGKEPEKHGKFFAFLETIPPDQLRSSKIEMPEYKNLVMYSFHTSYYLPDGSYRPVFDRKTALVLVDADARKVIDVVMGDGYRTGSLTTGLVTDFPERTAEWQTRDGNVTKYQILPTGFESIPSEN
jgi:hypothetical protein